MMFSKLSLVLVFTAAAQAILECPEGWYSCKVTRKCYGFFVSAKPWTDAREYCRRLGADLGTMRNERENQHIHDLIGEHFGQEQAFWFGLNDRTEEGSWRWLDETEEASYVPWSQRTNEPSNGEGEDCAFKQPNNLEWLDGGCYTSFPFICEQPANQTTSTIHEELAKYVTTVSNPDVLPQQDTGSPVEVHIYRNVMNIADVDKKKNLIQIEYSDWIMWDSGIVWNPKDFHNVDIILLPSKYFWTPRMQSMITIDKSESLSYDEVTVMSNGTTWLHTQHLDRVLCDVSQIGGSGSTCTMSQAPSGYCTCQVNIFNHDGDIDYFKDSPFELKSRNYSVTTYAYGGKTYEMFHTSITIREKSSDQCNNHGKREGVSFFWHN